VSDTEFWDVPIIPAIDPQPDDELYQWDELDRIEDLAFEYYRDSTLWWVIAKRNNLQDLPFSIATGDKIYIPSRTFVFEKLFTQQSTGG
jgi:hypothetical protein